MEKECWQRVLAANEGLKANLEAIVLFLRLGPREGGQRSHVIVREACGNVYDHIVNMEMCKKNSCEFSGHVHMSEAFYALWDADRSAKKIKEHVVPMKVLREKLRGKDDLRDIYDILKAEMKVVWVTIDEDKKLNSEGLRSKCPALQTRHEAVCIKHVSAPVYIWKRKPKTAT